MFARTKRLTLRPAWPEDAPALAQAIAHREVIDRLSHVPWPYTVDDAAAWLSTPRTDLDAALLVFDHDDRLPRLIGCVSLTPRDEGLTLGYWYTPAAWGRGYATEAGHAVMHIARHALPVRRLVSGYHVDNPASGNVLRKLGFRRTGQSEERHSIALGHAVETALAECDLDGDRTAMPIAA